MKGFFVFQFPSLLQNCTKMMLRAVWGVVYLPSGELKPGTRQSNRFPQPGLFSFASETWQHLLYCPYLFTVTLTLRFVLFLKNSDREWTRKRLSDTQCVGSMKPKPEQWGERPKKTIEPCSSPGEMNSDAQKAAPGNLSAGKTTTPGEAEVSPEN